VRDWLPGRVGFATAVYTNGLLMGEIIPVAVTIPVILPLADASWRASLVVWAAPVALIALVVALAAPRERRPPRSAAMPLRWWPDWTDALTWRLGLMLGSIQAIYFGTNAFLPDYLHHIGRPDLISAALTALNVGQLPASFMLMPLAGRLERQPLVYLWFGLLLIAGLAGILLGTAACIIAGAAMVGCFAAATLILMLSLPPLVSAPDDVHRMSAGMFTISYSGAVVVPVISGLAWDVSETAAVAFIPLVICALTLIGLARGIAVRGEAT